MSHDDRPWRNGDLPKPPPGVTASQAWVKGALAELKASEAADRALDMFSELGGLRRDVSEWLTPVDRRLAALEDGQRITKTALDEIKKILGEKLSELEKEIDETRTSSHDLSKHAQEIDVKIKELPRIDSDRVRAMVDERYETIISKRRLEELEKMAADLEAERKDRVTDKRRDKQARRTGLYIALVSGVVLALVTGVVTYYETRAVARDTVSAPR